MKKFFPLFFPFLLFADVKIGNINFTNTEVNMTIITLNYIDESNLNNILGSSFDTNCILDYRYQNRGIKTLNDLKNVFNQCDLSNREIFDLKQSSYKFSSDLIVDPTFGTTYPLTNFLYGLAGILVGFVILLGFIFAVK